MYTVLACGEVCENFHLTKRMPAAGQEERICTSRAIGWQYALITVTASSHLKAGLGLGQFKRVEIVSSSQEFGNAFAVMA